MYINAPVYSEQNGVHFINIYNELEDGTFRRTQDEPLRLLRNNIKGVSNIQGELLTSLSDRTERSWNSATVTFHYGHPKSFYTFLRDMLARNKYFVFSKPQLSGRISKFDLHELVMKPGTSQRHLTLLKEKYIESIQLWTQLEWEKKQQQNKQQVTEKHNSADGDSAGPLSLDVDFGQSQTHKSEQSEFIDLDKLGATGQAKIKPKQESIKRYGEVADSASDDANRQFPSRKNDRRSSFLERFIFTVD